MELDAYDRSEILTDIHRIEEILTTDIFECRNCRHPLALSAFIELMICLYDLMCKAEKYCRRIDFVDDVINTVKIQKNESKQVFDVTSLIRFVRNAACHIDGDNRVYHGVEKPKDKPKIRKGAGISFQRCFGKGGMFESLQSKCDDDQSFGYGEQLIYLKRHIVRAFEEAKSELTTKYPMIYPSDYIRDKAGLPKYKPEMVEKEYTIKTLVVSGPFQEFVERYLESE